MGKNLKQNSFEDVAVVNAPLSEPEAQLVNLITEPVDLVRVSSDNSVTLLREAETKLSLVTEILVDFHNNPVNSQQSLPELLDIVKRQGFDAVTILQDGEPVTVESLDLSQEANLIIKIQRTSTASPTEGVSATETGSNRTGVNVNDTFINRDEGVKYTIKRISTQPNGEPLLNLVGPRGQTRSFELSYFEAAIGAENGAWRVIPTEPHRQVPVTPPPQTLGEELVQWGHGGQVIQNAEATTTEIPAITENTGPMDPLTTEIPRIEAPLKFEAEQTLILRALGNEEVTNSQPDVIHEIVKKTNDRMDWRGALPQPDPNNEPSIPDNLRFTDQETAIITDALTNLRDSADPDSYDFAAADDMLKNHRTF